MPLKKDNINFELEATKVFLTLQGYLSHVKWPINDYETDLKLILDQAPRIIQAMLQITATQKLHLDTYSSIVAFNQCLHQGCWPDEKLYDLGSSLSAVEKEGLDSKYYYFKDARMAKKFKHSPLKTILEQLYSPSKSNFNFDNYVIYCDVL